MTFLYDEIKKEKKDIVIYGIGDGADKLTGVLSSFGLHPRAVCCSDDRYKEKTVFSLPLMRLSDCVKTFPDAVFLLAFGAHDDETISAIRHLSESVDLRIPDLPVAGDDLFTPEVYERDRTEIEKARSSFSDEHSRLLFDNIISAKLSGEPILFKKYLTERSLLPDDVFSGRRYDVFYDLGAYYGDTAREFALLMPGYKKIYAVEPDSYNYRRLIKSFENENRVFPINALCSDKSGSAFISKSRGRGSAETGSGKEVSAVRVDDLPGVPNLIKFDIEGNEEKALAGSEDKLAFRPDLIVSVYHRPRDIYRLTNILHSKLVGYDFYLRRFRCYPLWEVQLYCLSNERKRGN